MKIVVLAPRLDVSFKQGEVPAERSEIPAIRVHWRQFLITLTAYLAWKGHHVTVIEKPLWQFLPSDQYDADVVFIPHKEPSQFKISGVQNLYYMQTVFPELFSIDPNGWGSSLSTLPIDLNQPKDLSEELFKKYRSRIENNTSKFDQPQRVFFDHTNYILFLCQLPHDETIRLHSGVSVEQALKVTLEFAKEQNLKAIVKGHPINPGSMEPLKNIVNSYKASGAIYVDNVSIHDCIRNCLAAFTVNSGSGCEVILHNKPLFMFGNAEYDNVAAKCQPNLQHIRNQWFTYEPRHYAQFTYGYVNSLYHSKDPTTFEKLDSFLQGPNSSLTS